MSVPQIKAQGKVVDLNQNHYLGAGGEGAVYVKGGIAYKIYHDPAKTIPAKKIAELSAINKDNVLGPIYPITDKRDNPLGFAMRYVDKTEYLCKLFTKGFRDANNVSPQDINIVVKKMQETMAHIHKTGILVVDANEFNFLLSKDLDEPYFIDVDCYQTPHYPATAIMESIRDPQVKNNKFTEVSDWFSIAIVFFQLYVGTHPYKGRHPAYKKDWQTMMEKGISVFNKDVRMPPNTQPWSVVPKGHLEWFKKIFEHGERIAPPDPDQTVVTAGPVKAQIIASTARFLLQLVKTYDSPIKALRYIGGIPVVYTEKSLYLGDKIFFTKPAARPEPKVRFDFVPASANGLPIFLEFNPTLDTIKWMSLDNSAKGEIRATSFFVGNNRLYAVNGDKLIEHTFMNFGLRTVASQLVVSNVFHSHKTFDGLVFQDILGKCWASIPFAEGKAILKHIPELDKARIISAKYQKYVAVVVSEQSGKVRRSVFCFDKSLQSYTLREEAGDIEEVQFVSLDKGVTVATNEDEVELFVDNAKVKAVDDSPVTGGRKIYSTGNEIFITNRNELHKLSMR